MVKVFALIPRRKDISETQFHEHWAGPHAELAQRIATMRGYVQSHRVAPALEGIPESPYDGNAEVWFDDAETAVGMGEDPNYAEYAHVDEPNFIDTDRLGFLITQEHVLRAGESVAKAAAGIKVLLLLHRSGQLSPREFTQRLLNVGDRLAELIPAAQRLVLAVATAESYQDDAEPPYDALVELWFSPRKDFEEAWREAGESFLGEIDGLADPFRTCGMLAEELRVVWPEGSPLAGV